MINKTQQTIIQKYIQAKDKNKPSLLKEVFSSHAQLDMKLKTQNISFPSTTTGLSSIANVLVTEFNKNYQNIFTFCTTDSIQITNNTLSCDWFVVMSEKNSNDLRIGCGKYYWNFTTNQSNLVDKLTITIEQMVILPEKSSKQVFNWVQNLSYPWTDSKEAIQNIPKIDLLKPIEQYFRMVI